MLLLTRHVGERIRLECPDGTMIWITLVEMRRGRARIGIDAPLAVTVMREELLPLSGDKEN